MRTVATGSILMTLLMLAPIGFADQGGKEAPMAHRIVSGTVADHPHQYVTGKLIDISTGKNAIKLRVSEGEKTFSLERGNTIPPLLKEGAPVTVELNEAGHVIGVRHSLRSNVAERAQETPAGATGESVMMQTDPGLIF